MAGELLSLCRSLWAHSFVGPIYALLLHRWLLSRPDAGGAGERIKHLHVLISGARDLFIGVSSGCRWGGVGVPIASMAHSVALAVEG